MPSDGIMKNTDANKHFTTINPGLKPVALILAGYDKLDSETKKKRSREIEEAYDKDELYFGRNKFLHKLAGRTVIEYVIDAVYNARQNGERIYDKIFVYNDIKSFYEHIDIKQYPNLVLKQMTDSIAGHWKDFYFKYIEYGQRTDIFFGDTPRITPEDVENVHQEYGNILMKKTDHRGVPIHMIFSIVEYDDMKDDNWFDHRIKYIKRGGNKGKLKSFVGFENFQARIGNGGSMLKVKVVDDLINSEAANLVYNLRKAITPSSFSKILFHLWRTKRFELIKQVKHKCINEVEAVDGFVDVLSKLYKIDLSGYGLAVYHIKKNAARWENDIDGPRDFDVLQKKFEEIYRGK
ncbi:MAG: hypothetical protein MUC95_09275 [Spirochaetes bacterium]|jgi:hypothetical protein|nr:hypothetical protein [Spirochaetota bacterium]